MAGTTLPVAGNITISANTAYSAGGIYTLASSNWSTSPSYVVASNGIGSSSNSLSVTGDAEISGDLTVGGVSIVEVLAKIQDRLAILVPDPKKLEQYAALKEAYEHYKTLEALCVDETNPGK